MREAGERGALGRAQWLIQYRGNGELALLPPGIDEAHVITSLWRELQGGLHRYNRHASEATRLRMRIAVDAGQIQIADQGFAGDVINTACRLCDSAEVKDALRGTGSDLVLVISERIFNDVIHGRDTHDLPPSSFAEVTIATPDKEFRARAAYIQRRQLFKAVDRQGACGGRPRSCPAAGGAGKRGRFHDPVKRVHPKYRQWPHQPASVSGGRFGLGPGVGQRGWDLWVSGEFSGRRSGYRYRSSRYWYRRPELPWRWGRGSAGGQFPLAG